MTATAVLTVSGTIPADIHEAIAAGRRPRADYLEMAVAFDAELLDYVAAAREAGWIGRIAGRLAGPNAVLALACFRRRKRTRVIFTDGEQVGLPYAALMWLARRRPSHVMIGHLLSPRKKLLVHRLLQLHRRIDVVVVYASEQQRFAVERLKYPPRRVVLHPFMVDTEFWRPDAVTPRRRERPMVCAVGQELRDYATLVAAVRGLGIDIVIAAASPWSKREDSSAGLELPPNVHVGGYNLFELRQLYADAEVVVVPLEETDFQAGITTILEAMSMGKAVVCTRTSGQTDTVVDGETGVYVPTGDPDALRAAIQRLLDDRAESARLGAAGRDWARSHADIDVYVADLDRIVREGAPRRS